MWQPIHPFLRWIAERIHVTDEDPDNTALEMEDEDLVSMTCRDALSQYFETPSAEDSILDNPYPLNRYQRNRHVGLF